MTSSWHNSDDALMEELSTALQEASYETDRVELIMTGYDLAMLDVPEIESTFDSLVSATDPVRSSDPKRLSPRLLRFVGHGIEIELEITEGTIVGHVDPAGGDVFLDTIRGSTMTTADEALGSFEFSLPPNASFRVRLVTPDDTTLVTSWIGFEPMNL